MKYQAELQCQQSKSRNHPSQQQQAPILALGSETEVVHKPRTCIDVKSRSFGSCFSTVTIEYFSTPAVIQHCKGGELQALKNHGSCSTTSVANPGNTIST